MDSVLTTKKWSHSIPIPEAFLQLMWLPRNLLFLSPNLLSQLYLLSRLCDLSIQWDPGQVTQKGLRGRLLGNLPNDVRPRKITTRPQFF